MHKFLWLFGLVLVLGDLVNFAWNWMDNRSLAMAAGFLASLICWMLYVRARVGSIIAIKALLDKQETSFKRAWIAARLFYGRVLGVSVVIVLTLSVLVILLANPVFYFYDQNHFTQAWILGIFAVLIFIPALVLGFFLSALAPMFVVIFDLNIKESFDRSWALIRQFPAKLSGFGFIMLILQAWPVVPLSFLAYYIDDPATRIISAIACLLVGVMLLIYGQIAWILVFLELVKPQKFEEEKELPASEMISE